MSGLVRFSQLMSSVGDESRLIFKVKFLRYNESHSCRFDFVTQFLGRIGGCGCESKIRWGQTKWGGANN